MHPVAEFRAEVAELRAEIERLRAAIFPPAPEAPPPFDSRPPKPKLSPEEAAADYVERHEADARRREAEYQARVRASTEGLPDGHWRDPCGIIRDREGKVAVSSEHERTLAAAVVREQHAVHRERLQRQRVVAPPA